ncbi:MAG TPA: hypothetical protein VM661_17780 [Candidatus Sulfotelmatobacter sp.]|jgi:hypothetical protein|nr:hypothetical protein [Candidatus Sulfotelmatobacter sp.]
MLDDDPDVRRLFSRIGQIVVFHRHLHQALHDCCTVIFQAQGFDSFFAQAMMDDQDTEVVLKTWRNLVKDEFETSDPDALRPLLFLWQRLSQVNAAMLEISSRRWISDAPAPKAYSDFEHLPEPTLAGANLPLERVILDASNLCAALALIAERWPEDRNAALLDRAWAMAEGRG